MFLLAFFAYWAIAGDIPGWPLVLAWCLGELSQTIFDELKGNGH